MEIRFSSEKQTEPVWIHVRCLANFDLLNQAVRMAGTITDISIRKKHEERLLDDALHDPLTGLFNRTFFIQELKKLIHAAKRYAHPLCTAIININAFTAINEKYGHRAADELLVCIASIITEKLRSSDIAVRSHADTFYTIFPHTTAIDAYSSTERIRKTIKETDFSFEGKTFNASSSIAIADLTDEHMQKCNTKTFLEKLDFFMETAKKTPGRIIINGVVYAAD